MALKLNRPTGFGINADYHRIERFEVNLLDRTVLVWIASYLNRAARDAEKRPIISDGIELSAGRTANGLDGPIITAAGSVTAAGLYDALKQRAGWADAIDV